MGTKSMVFALSLAAAVAVSGCITVFPGTENEQREEFRLDQVCRDDGSGTEMRLEEAMTIVLDSICVEQGGIKGIPMCNENTGTWWFDLDIEKPGCMPACVVDVVTGDGEINWRCTGLISSE